MSARLPWLAGPAIHSPSPYSCPRGFSSTRRPARGSWGRPICFSGAAWITCMDLHMMSSLLMFRYLYECTNIFVLAVHFRCLRYEPSISKDGLRTAIRFTSVSQVSFLIEMPVIKTHDLESIYLSVDYR